MIPARSDEEMSRGCCTAVSLGLSSVTSVDGLRPDDRKPINCYMNKQEDVMQGLIIFEIKFSMSSTKTIGRGCKLYSQKLEGIIFYLVKLVKH